LKIAWQSHIETNAGKRKERSTSPSFSHPNSFLFHNFTVEEEEQRVEHVEFGVWTEKIENNKNEGKFIFFCLAKILKMERLIWSKRIGNSKCTVS
jgi:hypothetical protein